jgi:hypothetical protein
LPLQQLAKQAFGSLRVASAPHQNVEHHPGLIHRAPEPVFHPGDFDDDLIQVPFLACARQPTTDLVGERLAELQGPLASVDPLRGSTVADDDAPSGQQFLDHAQGKREAEIQPHSVADDLGWKPVPGVGRLDAREVHSGPLPDRDQPAKPAPS